MGFKLVRVDATESYKVILNIGSHTVGRGKFLDCNDNRVSRNHAELIVTSDSILLKSLHQNPCYFKEKSSTEIKMFSQPDSQVLSNGDQFGLVPDTFWYEVILCSEDSSEALDNNRGSSQNVNQSTKGDSNSNTQFYNYEDANCSESVLDEVINPEFNLPPETDNHEEILPANNAKDNEVTSTEQTNKVANQSDESINQEDETTNQQDETTNQSDESTNQQNERTDQSDKSTNQQDESPTTSTPSKRLHSEENSPCDIKRVKTEQESPNKKDNETTQPGVVKQEVKIEPDSPQAAKPGPSNDHGGPSIDGNQPAMPPSPAKPPPKLRERCMYGVSCYRRNPQHKAQFSHPGDPDWGTGPRGVCPWGAACVRQDPRHWRDHEHPPGVQPRPRQNRPGIQLVRRNGNNFYINANAVHFYDDHFQLEDSDGDSVDYDYEF